MSFPPYTPQYITYHKIVDFMNQVQQASPRLQSFGHGDIIYFSQTLTGGTATYPYMFVTPLNISYSENITTYELNIIFGDIVNTDLSNEIDVVSDMSLEARNLLSQIYRGSLFNQVANVELPSNATPFLERFNDHIGGVSLNLVITVFEDMNACPLYDLPEPTSTPICETPTPTPGPEPTPTISPSFTPLVYLLVEFGGTEITYSLWQDAGLSIPATALCDIEVEMFVYGSSGQIVFNTQTLETGSHITNQDVSSLIPGQTISSINLDGANPECENYGVSWFPQATPYPTSTPTVTPTNTTTPTVTPTETCPVTTQYLEVELSENTKFKLILRNNPDYTSPTNALCDYVISGTAYGDLGTVYSGTETILSGEHQHQFNLAAILQPGEIVSAFDVWSYSATTCVCPVNLVLPTPSPSPTPTITPTNTSTSTPTPTSSPVPAPLSFTVTSGTSVYESCNGSVTGTIYTNDLGLCGPCSPLTCFPCINTTQTIYLDPALTIKAPNGYYTNEMAPGNFGTIFIIDGKQQPGGFQGGCPGSPPSPPSGTHPYSFTGYSANTSYSTSCDANPISGGTLCVLYGDNPDLDLNGYLYNVPSGLSTVNLFGQYYFPAASPSPSGDYCMNRDGYGKQQGFGFICSSIC